MQSWAPFMLHVFHAYVHDHHKYICVHSKHIRYFQEKISCKLVDNAWRRVIFQKLMRIRFSTALNSDMI